jgi:signal recognition particle subunit SRP54
MFETVTRGFQDARLKFKGQARLSEENVAEALDVVRRSLLDADVGFGVVKDFIAAVKERCLGEVVQTKLKNSGTKVTPGDHFVEQCHLTLKEYLGGSDAGLVLERASGSPAITLLVGLQGAGKTTHAAKLARYLRDEKKMKPLLVAADIYRPAAREQLATLANREQLGFFSLDDRDAVLIAERSLAHAREHGFDAIIIDTAGRLTIDEDLMGEIRSIKAAVKPANTVLVIDAMIGQDAVQTAQSFNDSLGLTGVILTKLDGDTRGGAALSVRRVTGCPILFAGTGEGLGQLEPFRPDGMASRILGMGDIVGLMDDFRRAVDEEEATKSAERLMQGHFDFDDFLGMMSKLQSMGPIKDILAKTPLMGQLPAGALDQVNDSELFRVAAIIHSMTRQEKANPDLLTHKSSGWRSRMARIAKGSGRSENDVRELVNKFGQMRQMMGVMMGFGGGAGLLGKIPGLGGLNKVAGLARALKNMPQGGAGMGFPGGGLGGLPGMEEMMQGGRGGLSAADLAAINRERKKKKLAKQQKQKNRR